MTLPNAIQLAQAAYLEARLKPQPDWGIVLALQTRLNALWIEARREWGACGR